jgi:hypothetical protein
VLDAVRRPGRSSKLVRAWTLTPGSAYTALGHSASFGSALSLPSQLRLERVERVEQKLNASAAARFDSSWNSRALVVKWPLAEPPSDSSLAWKRA